MRERWASIARRYERWEQRAVGRFAGWSTLRRWVVFVLVPLLLFGCCGGVIGVPLLWLTRETIKAGKGAPTPDAAADAYLGALSYNQQDGLLPVLADEDQDALVAQWRAYRAAMDATDPRPFKLTWGSLDLGPIAGGRADVRTDVSAVWSNTDAQGRLSGYTSSPHTWVIEAQDDGDGWRVSRVAASPWCGAGGYVLHCGPRPSTDASSTPAPSDSPSDDPLQVPREMLPCGPRDPFPELHSCPPSSPSASPSGG
uniref:hypothetical protein n=1 Tax=Actinoplanes sp. CA-084688 TaxID=3239901 RepID=UPI003F493A2B